MIYRHIPVVLLSGLLFLVSFFVPFDLRAQELLQDTVTFVKAEVIEVLSEESGPIEGTSGEGIYQTIRVKLLEGPNAGSKHVIDNDYLVLHPGEVVYLRHTIFAENGSEYYVVSEPYRLPILGWLVALFLLVLFMWGGWQGVRGLITLAASIALIMYVLLPGILAGYSPILLSLGIAALIIVVGSYVTHGVSRTTSAAVLGMLATLGITGALAFASIYFSRLSGYSSEEVVYLNFSSAVPIDFVGLLLGGLLIGLLGVLYDAAIGQAVAIEELAALQALSKKELFTRGMRIGKEHVGALVNTLAIAYVGVSLPLLLFLATVPQNMLITLNQELFATEIIRILVGSIGLILAIPITTAVAVIMLYERVPKRGESVAIQHHH